MAMKVLLATDGSEYSRAAVDTVADRLLPSKTESKKIIRANHKISGRRNCTNENNIEENGKVKFLNILNP